MLTPRTICGLPSRAPLRSATIHPPRRRPAATPRSRPRDARPASVATRVGVIAPRPPAARVSTNLAPGNARTRARLTASRTRGSAAATPTSIGDRLRPRRSMAPARILRELTGSRSSAKTVGTTTTGSAGRPLRRRSSLTARPPRAVSSETTRTPIPSSSEPPNASSSGRRVQLRRGNVRRRNRRTEAARVENGSIAPPRGFGCSARNRGVVIPIETRRPARNAARRSASCPTWNRSNVPPRTARPARRGVARLDEDTAQEDEEEDRDRPVEQERVGAAAACPMLPLLRAGRAARLGGRRADLPADLAVPVIGFERQRAPDLAGGRPNGRGDLTGTVPAEGEPGLSCGGVCAGARAAGGPRGRRRGPSDSRGGRRTEPLRPPRGPRRPASSGPGRRCDPSAG